MDTDISPNPETLFRPVKRRKFLRRREREPEDTQEESRPTNEDKGRDDPSASHSLRQAEDAIRPTDIARLRRQHRVRKGGIEFSNTSGQTTDNGKKTALTAVTAEDLEDERIQAMCDRFTAHTGQTVDVDKHMMAYIDSEMARRYRNNISTDTPDSDAPPVNEAPGGLSASAAQRREPASLGKLHEIDLGQETKLRNIVRTEVATRRLAGDDDDTPPVDEESVSKNAPAGKDGRSWRNRKRRNSEDIERDRLVEEVLRESKLDVYDEPEEEEALADDLAADERVAEQFRREFLDAIQSRRRVARARNTKPATTAAAKPTAPRGPKLGGSRSARAAMREMQEKSARK